MKYYIIDHFKTTATEILETIDKYKSEFNDINDTVIQIEKIEKDPLSKNELNDAKQLRTKLFKKYVEINFIRNNPISHISNYNANNNCHTHTKPLSEADQLISDLSVCQIGIMAHVLIKEQKINNAMEIIEFVD